MKLCGNISVELDVGDFVQAAGHQKRLEEILQQVRLAYPDATLTIRERRQRKATPADVATNIPNGAIIRYADN